MTHEQWVESYAFQVRDKDNAENYWFDYEAGRIVYGPKFPSWLKHFYETGEISLGNSA